MRCASFILRRWATPHQAAQLSQRAKSKMNSVSIRRATLSDALALSELAASTFAETFGADNTTEDLAAHLQSSYGAAQQSAELSDPDVMTLLAYTGTELVGFAQVRRKSAPDCVIHERCIELHRFYLVLAAHGRGVAAPLMVAARAAAQDLGGLHLWLGVWERNPRAVAFYIKSGFAQVGSHHFLVGSDRQTDWVVCQSIDNAGGPCHSTRRCSRRSSRYEGRRRLSG